MTHKTHLVGGVVLASVIHQHFFTMTEVQFACYYAGALVGSLLPDIDHPKSLISQTVAFLHYPFRKLGHRKATHSLFAVTICMGLMYLLFGNNYIGLGLGIGYSSHLLLDMLNPRGVPLLYPFIKYKYKVGNIHTGEKGEEIIYFLLVVSLLIIIVKEMQMFIHQIF